MNQDELKRAEDVDKEIHRQENEGAPASVQDQQSAPDSQADFEKAMRGGKALDEPRIPPANAD